MKIPLQFHKDYLGAAMLVVLGAAVLVAALGYSFGNLNHMGAGFTPVVFGVLLIAIGIAIAVTTQPSKRRPAAEGHGHASGTPDWRGWTCILGGVFAFVVLGQYGGMVPATFASVLISAMGDRQNTWKSAALLAAVLTVFCIAVFHFGLRLQMPLLAWG